MRLPALRHLVAAGLGIAVSSAALAADDSAAAWHAAQRAHAAHEALSSRYTAIWATLDRAQKSSFSARERAWLNEGRQLEQEACLRLAGQHSELAVKTCEAAVIERRLGTLAVPQRVAVSS